MRLKTGSYLRVIRYLNRERNMIVRLACVMDEATGRAMLGPLGQVEHMLQERLASIGLDVGFGQLTLVLVSDKFAGNAKSSQVPTLEAKAGSYRDSESDSEIKYLQLNVPISASEFTLLQESERVALISRVLRENLRKPIRRVPKAYSVGPIVSDIESALSR